MGFAGKRFAARHHLLTALNFTPVSLKVDTALWGSFWHGDVISPGYTLPALEVAFLRETKITQTITLPTPADYLAALRNALTQSPHRYDAVMLDGVAARRISAAGWVVWLINGEIVAGYPEPTAALRDYAASVLEQYLQWQKEWHTLTHATRIDRLIQVERAQRVIALPPAIATD